MGFLQWRRKPIPVPFWMMERGKRYRVTVYYYPGSQATTTEGKFSHYHGEIAVFQDGEYVERGIADPVEVMQL